MNEHLMKLSSELLCEDSKPSPELCDFLGNKAAQMALDANIPLSDAVVKVASGHQGLNNTHITNICQFANNEYFRKVASARKEAGENLVFEYPLADPPDVVKQINTEASPKLSFIREVDYDTPPVDSRIEKSAASGLAQKFFGEPPAAAKKELKALAKAKGKKVKDLKGSDFPLLPKKYSSAEPYSLENPIAELGSLRETVGRVYEESQTKLSSLRNHTDVVEDKLYKLFKQAMLSDIPVSHVAHLWQQHKDGHTGVEQELPKLAAKLAQEEPILFAQVQKTAHVEPEGIPDTSHSLYDTYNTLRTLRGEMELIGRAEKIAEADLEYITHQEARGLQMMHEQVRVKRVS